MTPAKEKGSLKPQSHTKTFLFDASEEPGMSLSKRQWDRHLERIAECKEGLNNLWLGAAMAFLGIAGSGVFALFALPEGDGTTDNESRLSERAHDVLLFGTVVAVVLVILCLAVYFTRKKDHDKAIDEVIKDMRVHEPVS